MLTKKKTVSPNSLTLALVHFEVKPTQSLLCYVCLFPHLLCLLQVDLEVFLQAPR